MQVLSAAAGIPAHTDAALSSIGQSQMAEMAYIGEMQWQRSISTRHEQEHVLLKLTSAADRMLFIAHSAMHSFSACECMQRLLLAHLRHLQQHDALHLEEEQECTWVLTT